MSTYAYPAPAPPWPRSTNPNTSGLRRKLPRVECPDCRRLIPANGIGSHRRTCGTPELTPVPAPVSWACEEKAGRFAELDAAIASKPGRGRWKR